MLGYLVGGGLSAMNTLINNGIAKHRENISRQQNYMYNEFAAENADKRTRALYSDLYSPAARMQQLKDAGLSPSLFYEGAGVGGSTQQGAMGAGVSGISPQTYGITAADAAQFALLKAQKENIEADTDNKRMHLGEQAANIEKTYAEIGQIFADKGLKEAQTSLVSSQRITQELVNYVKEGTKDFDIKHAYYLMNKAKNDSDYSYYLAKKAGIEAYISDKTKETLIEQTRLQNAEILASIAEKDSNVRLNDTERENLINEIDISQKQLQANIRAIEASEKSNEIKEKEIQQEWDKFVNQYRVSAARYNLDVKKASCEFGIKYTQDTFIGNPYFGGTKSSISTTKEDAKKFNEKDKITTSATK